MEASIWNVLFKSYFTTNPAPLGGTDSRLISENLEPH